MKCPSCHEEPIAFKRWLVMFDPVRLVCRHCGAKLKLNPHWRTRYHVISILVAVLVLTPTALSFFDVVSFVDLGDMYIYAGVLVILSLVGLSAYFWKRFEYTQEQE